MPILNNVLGLDLGSHSLKAVELRQGLRSLESVNARSVPREAELSLSEQVLRFVTVHRLATDHVVTAVRGDRVSVRRLSFPFSERRRLAQAVPFEVEDALPFNLEDIVLDWLLAHSERHRADVVAAIAQRTEVSELIAALHEAGCDPRAVEAEGLVLANLSAAFELPESALLVDLGHSKTTLCALSGGTAIVVAADSNKSLPVMLSGTGTSNKVRIVGARSISAGAVFLIGRLAKITPGTSSAAIQWSALQAWSLSERTSLPIQPSVVAHDARYPR